MELLSCWGGTHFQNVLVFSQWTRQCNPAGKRSWFAGRQRTFTRFNFFRRKNCIGLAHITAGIYPFNFKQKNKFDREIRWRRVVWKKKLVLVFCRSSTSRQIIPPPSVTRSGRNRKRDEQPTNGKCLSVSSTLLWVLCVHAYIECLRAKGRESDEK